MKSPSSESRPETSGGERIARRMARAGVASRRDAEQMIEDGRVTLNGQPVTSPAVNVTMTDRILVDGQPIPDIERTRLWLFHKPAGMITTNRDPEGRRTVFDALPRELPRVIAVGRLDFNTEGLLLLTNDGGLARQLELPSTGWLRRYRVRAHGKVTQADLDRLAEGIAVDGVLYGAIEAELEREQGSNAWLTLGLREGKNREVRNVLGALGLEVNRLIRISYGPFQLGSLEPGAVMEVRGRHLREQLGEKLVAAAGCNFDAPVMQPFSNKPVTKDAEEKPAPARAPRQPDNAKRRAERQRTDALDRLDTRKPGRGERDEKHPMSRDKRRRAANVWMAPGARPTPPAKPGEEGEAKKPKRYGKGTSRPNRGTPSKTQAARLAAEDRERSERQERHDRTRNGEAPKSRDGSSKPRDFSGKPRGFAGKPGKPGGRSDGQDGKPKRFGGKPGGFVGKPRGQEGPRPDRDGKPAGSDGPRSGQGGKPFGKGGRPQRDGAKPPRDGKPAGSGGPRSGQGGKPFGKGGRPPRDGAKPARDGRPSRDGRPAGRGGPRKGGPGADRRR
ncbi:MAG: pseudouridine synthase [Brucellaceae bacterium]|nr:pseudouridine synthase [Brucellaceae bacterium]